MNSPIRRFLSCLALLVLALTASTVLGGEKPFEKVFVGYLYGPPRDLKFGLYTHLCHAFVTADAEGRVEKASRNVPSRELAGQAHKAGVRMLISLGGWGYDEPFAAITSKPKAEDRYVQAILEMVDEADYDAESVPLKADWAMKQ